MNCSQILEERPFNILDGERYLVVVYQDNVKYVLTRKHMKQPILTRNFTEAKTYKNLSTLEKTTQSVFINNNIVNFNIFQVKDLFTPKYHVEYELLFGNIPKITHYAEWYLKGTNEINTYIDYDEARNVMEKYKRDLLEFHYKKILDLKKIQLVKIEKATH